MDFFDRVKEGAKQRSTTIQYVVEKAGLKLSSYNTLRLNNRLPRADEAIKIAEQLGTTVEYLVTGRNSSDDGTIKIVNSEGLVLRDQFGREVSIDGEITLIPIYDQRVAAGPGQEFASSVSIIGQLPFLRRMLRGAPPERAMAIEVRGDSMTGIQIFDGDMVVFIQGEIRGDGIYVLRVGDELIVKRVEFDSVSRKHGMDPNGIFSKYKKDPLTIAAIYNPNPEVLEVLCNAGATVNGRLPDGSTVLMSVAANSIKIENIQKLIDLGAEVNDTTFDGSTPLIFAARSNADPRVFRLLIKNGADVNKADKFGMTPLMYASEFGRNPAVISTLLELGADPNLRSNNGLLAIDYAALNDNLKSPLAADAPQISNTTGWASTKFGSYKIERLWSDSGTTYVLVSYRNTTTSTFKEKVTITTLLYDRNGSMIDMDDDYIFASNVGPIAPGFEGTVKVLFLSVSGADHAVVRLSAN